MRLRDYIIRRLFIEIPLTLFGLSILIFYITRVMPGDPIHLYLGLEATPEQIEFYRKLFGLDKPIWQQYIDYWKNFFLHGSLGLSLYTSRDVMVDIKEYLPNTLELVISAMIFSVIVGVIMGVTSAMFRYTWIDSALRLLAVAGVSLPRFWVALMLQLALGYYLGILPMTGKLDEGIVVERITGITILDSILTLNFDAFVSVLKHLALPVLALSLSPIAQIMRIVRASILEELSKPYVITLSSMGIHEKILYYKYALRSSLVVAITIVGLLFGFFIYGAFAIEIVFGWPGIGWYAVQVGLHKDFNAIVAVVMLIGLIYTFANFVVDVLYNYLDPRLRLKVTAR